MKQFFTKLANTLTCFLNGLADARVASAYARAGDYEKAKNIYK